MASPSLSARDTRPALSGYQRRFGTPCSLAPPSQRSLAFGGPFSLFPSRSAGRGLCVQGAYRWVRHPLYASFITLGATGLALFFNHWAFLLWLVALHVIWHFVIPLEERLMLAQFGDEYRAYAQRTGRFIPRLSINTAA